MRDDEFQRLIQEQMRKATELMAQQQLNVTPLLSFGTITDTFTVFSDGSSYWWAEVIPHPNAPDFE